MRYLWQFLCRCVSHFFLLFLLIITACIPLDTIQSRESFLPRWYEWVLLSKYHQPYITASVIAAVWVSGLLLTELTTVGERSSVGVMKPIIVFFGAVAVGIHLTLFFIPTDWTNTLLYIRNQFLAWSFLCGMIQILDFLKFHHMFGPWAIIISSLIVDLGKFLTVLCLFLVGFSMLITAMNTPFYALAAEVSHRLSLICLPLHCVAGGAGGGGDLWGAQGGHHRWAPLTQFSSILTRFGWFGCPRQSD